MRNATASLVLLAIAAIGVTACSPGTPAPATGSSAAAPVPTTVPTAQATTPAAVSDVVARMKWCVDTCIPQEATVVMRDGRVVWNEPNVGVRQGVVSPEGVAWITDQLDATGLFQESGSYDATLRPGAQPPGGGVTTFDFTVSAPVGRVRVQAGIPGNASEEYWIVPDELRTLVDLGGRMMDAGGWVPADLWLEGPEPYEPQQYLFLVTLSPQRTSEAIDPRAVVDVDQVPWPVSGPIDISTPVAPGGNDSRARCTVLDATTAERFDAAQRESGSPGEPRSPFASRAYLWERGDGYLTVEFQSLLPDEHDCQHAQFSLD